MERVHAKLHQLGIKYNCNIQVELNIKWCVFISYKFWHFANVVKSNNRNTFAFYRLYQSFSFGPFGVGGSNNDGIGSHWNGPWGMVFVEVEGGGSIDSHNYYIALYYLIYPCVP